MLGRSSSLIHRGKIVFTRNKHDEVTDAIRRHPYMLNLEGIVMTTGEVHIMDGTKYVTSPDNLLFTRDHTIYVVEYKSSDSRPYDAIKQLRRHKREIERYFSEDVRALYVYGPMKKLQVEEL